MDQVTTTVLIDSKLKDLAKEYKINISATLNDALKLKLGTPNKINELEIEKIKLQTKIAFIEAKVEELRKEKEEAQEKFISSDYDKQIIKLKQAKKRVIENNLDMEIYNKMVHKVAEYYGKNFSDVVANVDQRSYIGLEKDMEE